MEISIEAEKKNQSKNPFPVGTVLEFDERRYKEVINAWEAKLFPVIETLKNDYEVFEECIFDQDSFREIMLDFPKVENRYRSYLKEKIKLSGLSSFMNEDYLTAEIPKRLSNLRATKGNLDRALTSAIGGSRSGHGALKIDFSQIQILDGKPIINEEKIKQLYTKKITTEEESKVLAKLLELKKTWDEFVDMLSGTRFEVEISCTGPGLDSMGFTVTKELLKKNEDGKAVINPVSLIQ